MAGTRLLDVIVDVALFACHNGVSLILTLFNIFPNPYPVQCISIFHSAELTVNFGSFTACSLLS
jgi:hypothetical protein